MRMTFFIIICSKAKYYFRKNGLLMPSETMKQDMQ